MRPPIQIEIPNYWTPEEALAVFELIEEIREKISAVYGVDIQNELQSQRTTVSLATPHDDIP